MVCVSISSWAHMTAAWRFDISKGQPSASQMCGAPGTRAPRIRWRIRSASYFAAHSTAPPPPPGAPPPARGELILIEPQAAEASAQGPGAKRLAGVVDRRCPWRDHAVEMHLDVHRHGGAPGHRVDVHEDRKSPPEPCGLRGGQRP